MPKVHKTREVEMPADELWQLIGDFHGLHRWIPNLEPSESLDDGQRRRLPMGGAAVVERLLEEGERSYTYTIDEGPLPLANYRSTLSVRESDGKSVVDWVGEFEAAEGTPEEAAVSIVELVYEGGLSGLEQTLAKR